MPALVVDSDGSLCKADVLETMRLAQQFLSIVGSSRMPIIMVGMDKIDSVTQCKRRVLRPRRRCR